MSINAPSEGITEVGITKVLRLTFEAIEFPEFAERRDECDEVKTRFAIIGYFVLLGRFRFLCCCIVLQLEIRIEHVHFPRRPKPYRQLQTIYVEWAMKPKIIILGVSHGSCFVCARESKG